MFSCSSEVDAVCPDGYTCEADGCCHRDGSDVAAEFGGCGLGKGDSAGPTTAATDATTTSSASTSATSGTSATSTGEPDTGTTGDTDASTDASTGADSESSSAGITE